MIVYADSMMPATQRITLDLDRRLLAAVDVAAAERKTSRSRFLVETLQEALHRRERGQVDAAFARMADDPAYRAEIKRIETAFAGASDGAWRLLDAAERRLPPRARGRRPPDGTR
jgi:hypothetical protein